MYVWCLFLVEAAYFRFRLYKCLVLCLATWAKVWPVQRRNMQHDCHFGQRLATISLRTWPCCNECFLFAGNTLDAAFRWCSKSWLSLFVPDKMYPSHLWQPSRPTTATLSPLGVVRVFGGWVCVVSNLVVSSLKSKPTSVNATGSSWLWLWLIYVHFCRAHFGS